MPEQFQDQGGAATSNPSPPLRWAASKFMTWMASPKARARRRARVERRRRRAGAPHRVTYFHQVDDGYSHLAAQLLRPLLDHYEVELACHLVTPGLGPNLPEPELLLERSRYDAVRIAGPLGLRFPEAAAAPQPEAVALASRILAATPQDAFPERAVEVGEALFSGDRAALDALVAAHGAASPDEAEARIREGNARRATLGHYSGAMLHYGEDWYWGADRFDHLERRLLALGARRDGRRELLCPRPPVEPGPLRDDGSLTLEIYPSLRSPYTSIVFDRALALARETGVRPVVRPVLPMVMRGVPATRQKGAYIFADTAREAEQLGLDWGRIYDPIGAPVRRAYSLYPWARERGRGNELLSSFLRAAFSEGVNTNRTRGLRHVVERAGLPWAQARPLVGNTEWEEELEANRLAMYGFGCWGVPSFRLLDAAGREALAVWGQDRLWLVSRRIQELLGEARAPEAAPPPR